MRRLPFNPSRTVGMAHLRGHRDNSTKYGTVGERRGVGILQQIERDDGSNTTIIVVLMDRVASGFRVVRFS